MGKHKGLFWQLIEKEHKNARAYCFKLTGSLDDGDDLYQDSVIRAYRGFSGLKNVESFRPWLYRIVNNVFKGRFRQPWWKKVMKVPTEIKADDRSANPSCYYEARRRLNYAMAALSTDDRILVTLADLEGWKISELAGLLSKSEGYIKVRLSRARKKMRRRLSSLFIKGSTGRRKEESVIYAMSPDSKKTE